MSKKTLAEKTNLAYSTVNNWGSSQNIPHWVESWLENYIKARCFEKIVEDVEAIKKDKILATIVTDIDLELEFDSIKSREINSEGIIEFKKSLML